MKHQVKTGHGTSCKSIQSEDQELWIGIGQGRAAAGPAWLSIEVFMFTHMNQHAPGAYFRVPKNEVSIKLQTIGYIDDNNLLITGHDDEETSYLAMRSLTEWTKAVRVSGG